MSNNKPHNKKSPEGPQQSKRANPEYPWVRGEADVNGRHKLIHADPSKPDESFTEQLNHDGSFEIHETLKDEKGLTNVLGHHRRSYFQTGSDHYDGNYDHRSFNKSVNVDGEHGIAAKKGIIEGTRGAKTTGYAKGTFDLKGGRGSKNHSFQGNVGDHTNTVEGNQWEYSEKDHAQAVGGSKYTMVGQGDYGIHVQNGNMDTNISGKGQIVSQQNFSLGSNAEITVSADTKLTLKVGDSKIVIEKSKITITSAEIEFKKN